MYGVYINYKDPFGSHYLGICPTLKRVAEFLSNKYHEDIKELNIKNHLDFIETYYNTFSNGDWVVVKAISPRLALENINYYKKEAI
jgi:hypothetical protein